MSTNVALQSTETIDDAVARARNWVAEERAAGTLVGEETLWREAYRAYLDVVEELGETERVAAWACIASALVFDTGKVPLNLKVAAREACGAISAGTADLTRHLHDLAKAHDVDPSRIRGLLGPGIGYPWAFPRALWTRDVVARSLETMLAPFDWSGPAPDAAWLDDHALRRSSVDLLLDLEARAPERSMLRRSLAAVRAFVGQLDDDGKDAGVVEAHAFIAALAGHGLSSEETSAHAHDLLALQEAVVLARSFQLYQRAEGLVALAGELGPDDPTIALDFLEKAAAIYKRLAVAQQYAERLLERQQQVWRMIEDRRVEHGIAGDDRADHVLLVGTFHSPTDLQRLLLSVTNELQEFGYSRPVHVVVSDDSTGEARARNEEIYAEAARSGLRISEWGLERRNAFLARLNEEVFADDPFDVNDLAGVAKAGEKGIPYGRLRNFLRLAGLVELRKHGLDDPVFTWLDQDNELGALVLTRSGTLSKRHVFNYFDQKSDIFSDPRVLVGGGGYTNDALEGVEKFWVAWGIMHTTLGLAREHAPQGAAVLSSKTDITRFRPWDQPDTLERLPREGEDVETMSDQFLLLLNTLIGVFRGKYDNQVQIYHPWSGAEVEPGQERLVEEMRAFAGMPGGNTSFGTDVLASPIPFLTVCGRGEDIFHLWQLEAAHGTGSCFLTHTPVLHTRNVKAGRGNLMSEIINSFNGRIFREPPYLWAALSSLFTGEPAADVEIETAERIEGLRAEAKASMSAVSGLAEALAPFVDESGEFWWVAQARDDPRCAAVLSTLRGVVEEFRDVDRYHRMADAQLLTFADVKELTAEFMAAYPHWETVVEKVGGLRFGLAEDQTSKLAQTRPLEDYGSPMRVGAAQTTAVSGRIRAAEPAALGEPVDDLPWQEALTSALLLFRRYEQGVAEQGGALTWEDRRRRLRAVFDHYAVGLDDPPRFLWARLFRDALFVPHSAPYRALTELLEGGDPERLASVHGVDPEVLRLAAGGVPVPA